VLNLRELGGYPTATGRETLRRRLLRSDDLDKLAPVGQKTLIEYGLRTVIDLRDPQEAAGAPDVFAATAEGVGYYHLPFFDDEGRRAGPPDLGVSKGSRYLAWLDLYPENIREIFRVMVAAGEGVTLFHCAAGKDRTGLVAGLMLALADVADDVIDADYAISAELLVPRIAELRAEAVLRGEDMILFERRAACLPETMQEVLDGLRAKYGGAEGYLRLIGLSEEEIATLNVRLLE
jgi:protein-tyrosine phosphatase